MISDIEMALREMGIPLTNGQQMNKIEKVMTINSGALVTPDNSLPVKRTMVHLATNRGLRAAHIFLVENNQFEWNLFFPGDEPLTQAEVNGHLMFAIEYIKHPDSSPLCEVEKSGKKIIYETSSVIEYLEELKERVPIFVVLVFDNTIFTTGNFISETMLCKAILNYTKPEINKTRWPDSDRRSRMFWYANRKKCIFNCDSFHVSKEKSVIRTVK